MRRLLFTLIKLTVLYTGISFFFIPQVHAASAATLQFDPTSINASAGQSFETKIQANIGDNQVVAVDAYILYDPSFFELQAITYGNFFTEVYKNTDQIGKILVSGVDSSSAKSGKGTLATISFKAKKSGTSNITFDCVAGSTSDSNIIRNDQNATDIIDCSTNGKLAVNVGTDSQPTNIPSPTSVATITSSPTIPPTLSPTIKPTIIPTSIPTPIPTQIVRPTVSELPRTGSIDKFQNYTLLGVSLAFMGIALKFVIS